jgi:hypothetical protein
LVDYRSTAQREDGGKKSGIQLLSVLANDGLVQTSGVGAPVVQEELCIGVWDNVDMLGESEEDAAHDGV